MITAEISKKSFDRLVELRNRTVEARRQFDEFKRECRIKAPVERGDVITVNGFSFRGKEMQVQGISLHEDYSRNFYWKAFGQVLKKNGEPGVQQAESSWMIRPEKE